jgi:hypothetical protein
MSSIYYLLTRVLIKKIKQNIGIPPHDNFPMFQTHQSADFSAELVSQFTSMARTVGPVGQWCSIGLYQSAAF